jgi:methylenetetrahydrofolate reductase (NADPH)
MTLPSLSFEFFPPKTEEMERHLWSAFAGLSPLAPQFVSVTYGAGGQARSRTHEIVTAIQAESGIQAAAHLTCIGASADEIATIADAYWQAGIKHIVALRGDLSDGAGGSVGAYPYAVDLVRALLARHPFEISVAAYPETHPQALSPEADLDNLKRKIDAGATRAITQFFFDNSFYYRFLERADKAGIQCAHCAGDAAHQQFCPHAGFCGALRLGYSKRVGGKVCRHWMSRTVQAVTNWHWMWLWRNAVTCLRVAASITCIFTPSTAPNWCAIFVKV